MSEREERAWKWTLGLLALVIVATGGWRASISAPGREDVLEVLVEAGASGREVREVARARGYSGPGWAKAIERELGDPELERELATRLARALGGTGAESGVQSQHTTGPNADN
ncbi:MAG: hypothetical protein HY816_21775 [Candidatus Wallbacteria bacterium]|nr:hypothetical protein [Candidatus Wallbacteria bacterium]